MSAAAATTRYTRVAIFLHWAIAACILFNLAVGFFMEGFEQPLRGIVIDLHISSGISVLALTVVRVIWRVLNKPPAYLGAMTALETHTAHFVHLLLYAAMVLMPLTGWGLISAHPPLGSEGAQALIAAGGRGGREHFVWGFIPLPSLGPVEEIGRTAGGVAPQEILHDKVVEWHSLGAFVLIALLVLHVAGALKHQFVDKEDELARMGIGRARKKN